MKRLLITLVVSVIAFSTPVKAEAIVHKAKATAYCLKGKTATGTTVTEGKTVASRPEWYGKSMLIYLDDGDGQIKAENYLGTYIVEDTGGKPIRNGYVVDIYMEEYDDCIQFGVKNIITIIVDSEG